MTWLGRKTEGGDERAAETSVASELAEFLVQATEESALRQAIDEGVRDLEQADARSTDKSRSTEGTEKELRS
jgi:hypothetical protein